MEFLSLLKSGRTQGANKKEMLNFGQSCSSRIKDAGKTQEWHFLCCTKHEVERDYLVESRAIENEAIGTIG